MFLDHQASIEELNRTGVSIPQNATVRVSTVCPPEGLTISACGQGGRTIVYISQTQSPSSAEYEDVMMLDSGKCLNRYINCSPAYCSARRRRQATDSPGRIYMTFEGLQEDNEYDLLATIGNVSTLQGYSTSYSQRKSRVTCV